MWSHILERSFTREVIRVYLEACFADNQESSLDGFLNWIRFQVKNRFMLFVLKLIWIHLFPCEVFRKGCRLNNVHYRIAAEKRMDVLLFKDNHRNYQLAVLERDYSRLALNPRLRRYVWLGIKLIYLGA